MESPIYRSLVEILTPTRKNPITIDFFPDRAVSRHIYKQR